MSEALSSYNRSANKGNVEAAERERKEVTDRFPIGGWSTLPLVRTASSVARAWTAVPPHPGLQMWVIGRLRRPNVSA